MRMGQETRMRGSVSLEIISGVYESAIQVGPIDRFATQIG